MIELFVGDCTVGIHELHHGGKNLLYTSNIASRDASLSGRGIQNLIAVLDRTKNISATQLVHDLVEVVGDETTVLGKRSRVNLRYLPAGQVTMNAIN